MGGIDQRTPVSTDITLTAMERWLAVIFYGRVSTLEQSIDHQVAQARAAGFQIDEVLADHGVSGVKFRLGERPEGRRLFDKLRSGDTLVVRWLDRLGRSYEDVVDCMRHFIRGGIIVRTVINNMTFDGATTDPVQQAVRDAMIAFLAATAQAQAEAIKIAQRAGIDAVLNDPRKYPGRRPSYDRPMVELVKALSTQGSGASAISKQCGLSRQTVIRIQTDPIGVERALVRWGM
jgi:putative DNA-invertase from lambdoid prophage Rac